MDKLKGKLRMFVLRRALQLAAWLLTNEEIVCWGFSAHVLPRNSLPGTLRHAHAVLRSPKAQVPRA